ncbi:MAG: aspartate kinase [Chlorobi bacterium]|nr:aspartate kinase [Chlorobiota bacterium]
MLVVKFGGTSVAGMQPLCRVASVVRAAASQPVLVVVSAFRGVTDALLECARSAAGGHHWETLWLQIAERHRDTMLQLELSDSSPVESLLDELRRYLMGIALLGECTPRMLDHTAAFGELLSSRILAALLERMGERVAWFDARRAIKTDARFTAATVEWQRTRESIEQHLLPTFERCRIVVTQGFIGSTSGGLTTTLGRGGSDYSAAIFGACLGAERVEIWTDVSGIYTADPRIVPDAVSLPEMTLGEVAALSAYGAKVLHPLTIRPAIEHGIPVVVRNTFDPEHPGTRIVGSLAEPIEGIRAIAMLEATLCRPEDNVPPEDVLASVVLRSGRSIVAAMPSAGDRSISLLCCVGAGVHRSGVGLEQLAAAARSVGCAVTVVGSTEESILAAVESPYGSEVLRTLHALVLSSQMVYR